MRPLGMLMGLTMIAVIVFSSIFYYAERGRYNEAFKVWERSEGYLCERLASSEEAQRGAPLHRTVHPCWLREPQPADAVNDDTLWICPYRWPRGDSCWRVWVQVCTQSPCVAIVLSLSYVLYICMQLPGFFPLRTGVGYASD
jgi:hypothetical protein